MSYSLPHALEWVLPDVLSGVYRLFLKVPTVVPHIALPEPATTWRHVSIDDTGLSVYTVQMALRTSLAVNVRLEAVFLDEPTLDQMHALEDFASSIRKRGLPALVSGQF
jgi:hypothetical protein